MPEQLSEPFDAAMSLTVGARSMHPVRVTVREALSTPYEVEVTAVHDGRGPIAPRDILHEKACVVLDVWGSKRRFHGLVRRYEPTDNVDGYQTCTLTIVPRIWVLGDAEDCRVFQDCKPGDIIRKLLSEHSVEDVAFRVSRGNETMAHCTQFNETGLAFLTRLMEEQGWYYFFEQSDRAERLVIADSNAALVALGPVDGHYRFRSMRAAHGVVRRREYAVDYNPERPTAEVRGDHRAVSTPVGPLSASGFSWPAHAADREFASRRARLRIEASEAAAALFAGEGEWLPLAPGHYFDLRRDAFTEATGVEPGCYAVRSVTHHAESEAGLLGTISGYRNSFEAFPYDTTWRQPMATPRPRIEGLHAALVIGATNDIVHTDELGRVKLQFFWEHRGETVAGTAFWARVVQPWAGAGWGAQFLPRVGTEVAVAFMDGDPDRPVVVGGLYNGINAPIYDKTSITRSGFRTRSFGKAAGGAEEFSEFTFDDKQGEERVTLHAQKDLAITVENDLDLKVDNCRIVRVVKDDTLGVDGKQRWTVKGDQALTVTEGSRTVVVSKGNHSTELGQGNYALVLRKGAMTTALDKGDYALNATLGDVTVKAAAGKVSIEAMQSITLKVGANSVVIDQMGVKINGLTLKLKGETMTSVESGLMTSVKGTMTEVKGEGMLVLKGALTMIN